MNLLRKAAIGCFGSLMLVASANAAYIDFGKSPFTEISGNEKTFSTTIENIGNVTLTAIEPKWATVTQTEDGIGIDGNDGWFGDLNSNEIEYNEVLSVKFDEAVSLNGIDFENLHFLGHAKIDIYGKNFEDNLVKVGTKFDFSGAESANLSYDNVTEIRFSAVWGSDYTLKGIDVPEPSMLTFLGAGLIAFCGMFSRKRK